MLCASSGTPQELEKLQCWTFHQLGHSLLTRLQGRHQHPMLLARCRYASVRPSSATRLGPEAVARHVARTNLPTRRRQPER